MRQYQPGYIKLRIRWDFLSSEDQDLANALAKETCSAPTATTKPVAPETVTPAPQVDELASQVMNYLANELGIPVHNREEMARYISEHGLNDVQMANRKQAPRHNKNDVSAFHLRRDYNELTNDIFKIPSERKYKREIQSFIKSQPEDIDRTKGLWYLSKDGKRCFKINTSVENFDENREETGYGFEVVDWYNTEKLDREQIKEIQDGYKGNAENLNSLLAQYESKRGGLYNSDSLLPNRETDRNNAGLDQEAPSGESLRRRNLGDSRDNKGTGEITQTFTTPNGEVYGFVTPEGEMYLDENIITSEHPIHEYTHIWDRVVAKNNPRLWQRGVELMKQTSLWKEIEEDKNYGKKWKASSALSPEEIEFRIASSSELSFVKSVESVVLL